MVLLLSCVLDIKSFAEANAIDVSIGWHLYVKPGFTFGNSNERWFGDEVFNIDTGSVWSDGVSLVNFVQPSNTYGGKVKSVFGNRGGRADEDEAEEDVMV